MDNQINSFDAGVKLRAIGASWFTSYSYYIHVDHNHFNWKKVPTAQIRISTYHNTIKYHLYWLNEILKMNEIYLSKNTIELNGYQIKDMAKEILNKINN